MVVVMVAVEEATKMLHLIKRFFITVLMVVFSTTFSLTAWAANKDIVIIYTNDIHCAIDDNEGLAGLVQLKQDTFAKTPYVAVVDAGDAIQGTPIGSLSRGEVFTRLMNNVGYDFAIPGNHEFDYGMERFLEIAKKLDCGYYSSNFLDASGKNVLPAFKIMTFGKTKIGFIGVTTPATLTSSTPKHFQDGNGNYIYSFCEDLTGEKLYKKVQKTVDEVRSQKVDFVIVVAHLGMNGVEARWSSMALAENVAGIDAIIDGHSHEVNPASLVEGKDNKYVLITQTGTKLKNIGQLTIHPDGQLSSKLLNGLGTKNPAMENVIARETAAFMEILEQPLGEAEVPLYVSDPKTGERLVRKQEVNMGNLVADAFRAVLNTDIAIINGGGIRKNIPQGVFSYKNILEVLPFGNMCTAKEISGHQILNALEMGACKLPAESGGFLQVSGMEYTIDATIPSSVILDEKGAFVKVEGAYRVQDVKIAGKPLVLDKLYSVAGNSYILSYSGNGMTMFNEGKLLCDDQTLIDADMLIEFVQNHLNAKIGEEYKNPYGEGRIKFKK